MHYQDLCSLFWLLMFRSSRTGSIAPASTGSMAPEATQGLYDLVRHPTRVRHSWDAPFWSAPAHDVSPAFDIGITDYHLENQLQLWQAPIWTLTNSIPPARYDLAELDEQECLLAYEMYLAYQTADKRRMFRQQQGHLPQLDHFLVHEVSD